MIDFLDIILMTNVSNKFSINKTIIKSKADFYSSKGIMINLINFEFLNIY